jgi:uncharacterized membrane protein YbhN (UPF0104 family)
VSTAAARFRAQFEASREHRLLRIAAWVAGIAVLLFVLNLLGVPVGEWISKLFDKISDVPVWAIVAGCILQTAQTSLAGLAWLGILRAAFPEASISYRLVLASYATAVALNNFLPANLGTLVMLMMFTALIARATFTILFSGFLVQKIPFSILNIGLYLYLFLSVAGSFSIKLGFLSDHGVLIALSVVGVIVLLVVLSRVFKERWHKLRDQLVEGGAILRSPRDTLLKLALPELGSYLAKLGVIAVFLGAYSIPVNFHNVATVSASNSVSNTVSVTPGGVGVNQAMNSAALHKETSASTATAYSISQQVITTAWNILFALVMVTWVFGWRGGKELVQTSYGQAKEKADEMKEARRAKRAAKASEAS